MAKETKPLRAQDSLPKATALWEQWLQRLSGTEERQQTDITKIELLELVGEQLTDSDQFFTRFGTILHRCINVPILIIRRSGQKRPLFSTISRHKEELIVRLLPEVDHSNLGLVERKLKGVISTDFLAEPLRFLYSLPLQDGQEKVCLTIVSTEPLSPETRKYLHFIELLLGIRRSSQELGTQLTQEKQRLEALTHHLSEGLAVLNSDLHISVWNRPLQRLIGFSAKEAIGHKYSQLLRQPDGRDWLSDLLTEYQHQPTKHIFTVDLQILTKRKEAKWVNISGSFIRNEQNQIVQTIALVRDVSYLKELEQRKNEFISIATHELRTPITAIKGYLSLLGRDTASFNDKQRAYLERAVEASERLVRLAEDLLQVVRVEENRLDFTMRPLRLSTLLQKICGDFIEKARQKGIDLSFHDSFPESTTGSLILGDKIRTEQIFANLVDNALKYTRRGSVTITLKSGATDSRNRQTALVEIRDTGIGIETRDISSVFEKFHRTRSASNSKESGVGLGLYIVKSFIEKQHGKINVQSRVGRGSTFSVTLPLAPVNKSKQRS